MIEVDTEPAPEGITEANGTLPPDVTGLQLVPDKKVEALNVISTDVQLSPDGSSKVNGSVSSDLAGVKLVTEKKCEEVNDKGTVKEGTEGEQENQTKVAKKERKGSEDADSKHAKLDESTKAADARVFVADSTKGSDPVDSDRDTTEKVKFSEGENTELLECNDSYMSIDQNDKSSDAALTKISEASDGDKTRTENSKVSDSEDVDMSEAEHMKDVDMAENEDTKLLQPKDAKLSKAGDTETPEVETEKEEEVMEGEKLNDGEVLDTDVTGRAENGGKSLAKDEDVEMSETDGVKDVKIPANEYAKVLDPMAGKLLEDDDLNTPRADETENKDEGVNVVEEREGKSSGDDFTGKVERKDDKLTDGKDTEILDAELVANSKPLESGTSKDLGLTNNEETKAPEINETKDNGGQEEEEVKENPEEEASREEKGSKKKQGREEGVQKKSEAKEKDESGKKDKEALGSPRSVPIDRPVRERKSVERLVEVLEKEQEQTKKFMIEKGRGTPLKDIPNVARKIARKKPADLKFLHQTLFGRIGKAVDYKNHILQYSGLAWHESEDKQKTKVKEKLDKCTKDALVDLCDLLDIPVSRAASRRLLNERFVVCFQEEVVVSLLEFMVEPHPTAREALDEKQHSKSRKRKRVSTSIVSKSFGSAARRSRVKRTKTGGLRRTKDDSDFESDDNRNEDDDVCHEDEGLENPESDSEELDSGAEVQSGSGDEYTLKSENQSNMSSRRKANASAEKSKVVSSPKALFLPSTVKTAKRSASVRHSQLSEGNSSGPKVLSREKKNIESSKNKSAALKPHDKEKTSSGKKATKGKAGAKDKKANDPSDGDLRKSICEILKEVDFNKATFTDIFKQLGTYYKSDLTPRKTPIKLMLQEELTKLADEAGDSDDED